MSTSALAFTLCLALTRGSPPPAARFDRAGAAERELVLLEEAAARSVLCLLALPARSAGEPAQWSTPSLAADGPAAPVLGLERIALELVPGALLLGFECAPEELEGALGALWREILLDAPSHPPGQPAPDSARLWRAVAGTRAAPLLRLPRVEGEGGGAEALRTLRGRVDPRAARIALSGPGLESRRERILALLALPPAPPELEVAPPDAPGNGLLVREQPADSGAELWLRCAPPAGAPECEALRVGLEALLGAGGLDRLRAALSAGPGAPFASGILLAAEDELQAWSQAPCAGLAPALAALERTWLAEVDALDDERIARARERLAATRTSQERGARLRRALLEALHGPRAAPALPAPAGEPGPDEVRAALRALLAPERRLLFAIGPAAELEQALAPLGPARRVDALGDADAGPALARLFAALGGREAWARARYVEMESLHHQGPNPPARLRTLRDLDAPRMRVEREAGGQSSTFVLWEGGATNRSGNFLQEIGERTRADLERRSWREIACLLHQLAARGEFVARGAGEERIELRSGPASGLWIELGDDGLPRRAGAREPDGAPILLEFADWRSFGSLLAPSQVTLQPDGWRRELVSLRPLEEVDETRFQRP